MAKAVLFDMDGVLVDNLQAHTQAFVEFGRRYGVEVAPEDIHRLMGRGNDEFMRTLLSDEIVDRVGVQPLADEKEEIYRRIFAETIEPVRGLRRFLSDLRARGVVCAVGSSGPSANVDFVLRRCDIAEFFTVIVSGDMVTRCKPDPEIYLKAASLAGFAPGECCVMEDSIPGIESAHAAGAKVVGIATTYSREQLGQLVSVDRIVGDFTELDAAWIAEL